MNSEAVIHDAAAVKPPARRLSGVKMAGILIFLALVLAQAMYVVKSSTFGKKINLAAERFHQLSRHIISIPSRAIPC